MDTETTRQENNTTLSIFSCTPGVLIAGAVLFFALVKADFSLALPAAGVLLVSLSAEIWVRLASSRISFSMKPDRERLFPGETLELELELVNNKFLPVWVNLELPSPKHLESEGPAKEHGLQTGLRLLSWESSRRPWRLITKRRGVSTLGPALISAGDLLGLGTRTRSCASSREIIVFPRRLAMKPLPLPFQEYFGMHISKGPIEDPAWYAGTRDYTGTRPAKNIHWKASARLGVLQEKLYEPTFHRKVLFILDMGSYMISPPQEKLAAIGLDAWREATERNFERMLETLGTLASSLMETGSAFGLVSCVSGTRQAGASNDIIIPAGRGPEQLGVFLEALSRMELPPVYESEIIVNPPQRLSPVLAEASRAYTGLVYCGDFPGEAAKDTVRTAGGRKKILFIFSQAAPDYMPIRWSDKEPYFENRPACLARDLCYAEEDAK